MSAITKFAENSPAERDLAAADLRFRALMGMEAWATLPEPVRRRFSKRLAAGAIRLYSGHVVTTELSRAGRILAFFANLIGSPLPSTHGATGPSVVAVQEDETLRGQIWSRSYARPGRFPQVVHSAKRFQGPTGLEEHVGAGIGMTLRVTAEEGTLVFRSECYFFQAAGLRLYIPRALSPGRMEIVHRQEAGATFSFRLTLTHTVFGRLVHQLAFFQEV